MSHFVFGLITGTRNSPNTLRELGDVAIDCSTGLGVRLGSASLPAVVLEMIGPFDVKSDLPFLLVNDPEDDQSDALISPYTVTGIENSFDGLRKISNWIQCVMIEGCVQRVTVWLTEGWDSEFFEVTCEPVSFEAVVGAQIGKEHFISSTKALVIRSERLAIR